MDTGLSLSDQVTLDKHYDCYLTAISSVYQMIFKKTDFKYLFCITCILIIPIYLIIYLKT